MRRKRIEAWARLSGLAVVAGALAPLASASAAVPDTTKPHVTAISRVGSSSSYMPGDTVTINYTIGDPDDQVTTAYLGFNEPGGHGEQFGVTGTSGPGDETHTFTMPVTTDTLEGTWTLDYVDLFDAHSNRGTYFTGQPIDYSPITFTVGGGTAPDTTKPHVTAISRVGSSSSYMPGDTVTINYTIGDPDDQVTTAYLGFNEPGGHGEQFGVTGTSGPGDETHTFTMPVTTDTLEGTWTLDYVDLFDAHSNRGTYFTGQPIDYSPITFTVGGTTATRRPSAPHGLRAEVSHRAVTLSWAPPANDGGTSVTSYRVEWSICSFASSCRRHYVDAAVTHRTVQHLAPGRWYHLRVQATNAVGRGAWSVGIRAKTSPRR